MLRSADGPLGELFESWGIPRPDWPLPADSIQDVLRLGPPPGVVLAVHGNYATEADLLLLEQAQVALAYCPRSHAYFGHPTPHPATRA